MANVSFVFNGVEYSGTHTQSNPYQACCEVLDTLGIAYTKSDTFEVSSYSRPKTFEEIV